MSRLVSRLDAAEKAAAASLGHATGLRVAPAAEWLRSMFPTHVAAAFAPHHCELLEWADGIRIDTAPRPFVGIWARGHAKSSLVEGLVAMFGLQGRRRYVLYVSRTQQLADQHVQNIARLLEADSVANHYPEHGERKLSKFGQQLGWRRDRLRTAGGLTVDAIGLDVASRGAKVDTDRPDLIVLDDIDETADTPRTTQRKLDLITRDLLPAGTSGCAVIAIQNLVHSESVFSKLGSGEADFLAVRVVSGPIPAIRGLRTERKWDPALKSWRDLIVAGEPTWPEHQGLGACQRIIDRTGIGAFLAESQHQVSETRGALWTRAMLVACRVGQVPADSGGKPRLARVVVGLDPSGGRDDIGVVVAGMHSNGKVYVLADRTMEGSKGPRAWATAAVEAFHEFGADCIVAEKNFGGDMILMTLKTIDPSVNVRFVTATRGKAVRAEPVASLYGSEEVQYRDSRVCHVGAFPELESELCTWYPGHPTSPNRLDALVWAITELALSHQASDWSNAEAFFGVDPLWRHRREQGGESIYRRKGLGGGGPSVMASIRDDPARRPSAWTSGVIDT